MQAMLKNASEPEIQIRKTFTIESVTVKRIRKAFISRANNVKYQKSKVSLMSKLVISPFGIAQI